MQNSWLRRLCGRPVRRQNRDSKCVSALIARCNVVLSRIEHKCAGQFSCATPAVADERDRQRATLPPSGKLPAASGCHLQQRARFPDQYARGAVDGAAPISRQRAGGYCRCAAVSVVSCERQIRTKRLRSCGPPCGLISQMPPAPVMASRCSGRRVSLIMWLPDTSITAGLPLLSSVRLYPPEL